MALNLNFSFDENLHEVLESTQDAEKHVQDLLASGNASDISQAGVFFRMLRRLDEAQACLEKASKLQNSIANQIRLAHVYQWQKKFNLSNPIFEGLLSSVQKEQASMQGFIWQHVGKNYFDQGRFVEALYAFEQALVIREAIQADKDQIESTRFSIREAKKRLSSN